MKNVLFIGTSGSLLHQEVENIVHPLGVSFQCNPDLLFDSLHRFDLVLVDGEYLSRSDFADDEVLKYMQTGGHMLILNVSRETAAVHALSVLADAQVIDTTPQTELSIQMRTGNALTDRLDAEVHVRGQGVLLAVSNANISILATLSWQYSVFPVVALLKQGSGSLALFALSPETLAARPLRQLVFRIIQQQCHWQVRTEIGMAMIGYGAIGFEHGSAIAQTAGLRYEMICDRSEDRLQQAVKAFPHVQATTAIEDILTNDAVDVVIVGTPPNTHAEFAMRALDAGKHVVVEKPFCMTTAEADQMISLAKSNNRMLTVYQNRRWDPDFRAIQHTIDAGSIGEIFHIETFIGGFSHPCNYWHSHEPVSGGVFYDWGSHYLDWILQLVGDPVIDVRATTQKRVWHDVTNTDQASLMLRFADGQDAMFIHSDVAAILKPKWYILGTRGAITGTWRHESVKTRKWSGDLIEERLAPSEALPEITVAIYETGGRIHQQHIDLPPVLTAPFHRNLADHLLWGEPITVDPASSRRNIAVMEAATYSARHAAVVVPIAKDYQ